MRKSNIFISKKAADSLRKLSEKQQERIREKINYLSAHSTTFQRDVFLDIVKLKGFDNLYRLRTGDYRIIFKYENGLIIIANIFDRKDAYRQF